MNFSNLDFIKNKIITVNELKFLKGYWKFKDIKVVFTNGCFDILHKGHIEYLAKASGLGDILVVGLNTDNSIIKIKGPSRPLQDESSRALTLASLQFVNYVILFDDETPYELIKKINPDILVKGSDYKKEDIVGYEIVKKKGGEIVTIDFTKGYSTTSIINKFSK